MRAKRLKTIVAVTAVMVSCLTGSFISQAAPGKPGKVIVESDPYDTMPDMPGVSFASDNGDAVQGLKGYEESGTAFTTDRGVTTPGAFGSIDYKTGDVISTGHWQDVPLIDTQVGVGQHLYEYRKNGPIKIKEWKLAWYWAQCIHNSYPGEDNAWKGIDLTSRKKYVSNTT